MKTVKERLEAGLKKQGSCLVWTKAIDKRWGYGRIKVLGRVKGTHVVAYELAKGPVPKEKIVRHTCDNPPCCNPAHLVLGSDQDNANDRSARGRGAKGSTHADSKLTEKQVLELRKKWATGKYTQAKLGAEYGVKQSLVSQIVNRKVWKHI